MPLIEWTRLPGESVETTIAMLLCGENFEATQVRPGQGDGGIDVFVPTASDLSSRDIYQVKRFAENLTSSQKRKIARSLEKVVATANEEGWTITSWFLVLPLNPTPPNITWFAALTKGLPFKCRWVGLNRIERLAANQPQVIDYYLRDGRERLEAQTARLAGVLAGRTARQQDHTLTPTDFIGDLRDIYSAMNAYDPHYRYEISITAEPPRSEAEHKKPGLVAIASSGTTDGWVNVSIFARSLAAIEERPITGRMEVQLGKSSDSRLRESFEKFVDFGTPVSLPEGSARVQLDLPGGLGSDQLLAATVSLSTPSEESAETNELALAVLSPEDEPQAEVQIRQVESTAGPRGGRRTIWVDKSGFITLEVLAKDVPDLVVNISVSVKAGGRRPSDIVAALEFLSVMHEPNHLALAQAFGPRRFTVTSTADLKERDLDYVRMARLARALVNIQKHTSTRLLYPHVVTGEQALLILDTAQLLEGHPRKATFDKLRVNRDPAVESDVISYSVGDRVNLSVVRDIIIEFDGHEYTVGREMDLMQGIVTEFSEEAACFEPAEDAAEVLRVRFDGDIDDGRVHTRPALR